MWITGWVVFDFSHYKLQRRPYDDDDDDDD
jgi:hypothetical protein